MEMLGITIYISREKDSARPVPMEKRATGNAACEIVLDMGGARYRCTRTQRMYR